MLGTSLSWSRAAVVVEPTTELIERTLSVVEQARSTAARLAPPAPLAGSPKCPRCSLVGICLPDETNLLAKRNDGKPRRLIAADPDAAPLYVAEPGSMVGIDGGRLTVSKRQRADYLLRCATGSRPSHVDDG